VLWLPSAGDGQCVCRAAVQPAREASIARKQIQLAQSTATSRAAHTARIRAVAEPPGGVSTITATETP